MVCQSKRGEKQDGFLCGLGLGDVLEIASGSVIKNTERNRVSLDTIRDGIRMTDVESIKIGRAHV